MTNNSIFTTILGIAGAAGITYAVVMHSKYAKINERLDATINDLANNMEIDISDELVNKAVEKAVNAAVKDAITKATNDAVAEVRTDIRRKVADAVNKEYDSVKDSVLTEITSAASKIDVAKVQKSVEEKAEKLALEKFEVELGGVIKNFCDKWDTAAKVFSAFQNMNGCNSARDFVVRLG